MFKVPLPELKQRILQSEKITAVALDHRIKEKINELSGLITEEGAAHIIANELGVELFNSTSRLKIKEIYAGMRNVSTLGKVIRKFELREFAKGESTGKVCSFMVGDETGTIRVVLWNEQTNQFAKINEDDVILLRDGYVRENRNMRELHLGDKSQIEINPPGEIVAKVRSSSSYERKKISELQEGEESAEILGTVIQVFDPRFFDTCSECNRKVTLLNGAAQCAEHGPVQARTSYVMNLILDDGSGTIRGVLWKNQTDHLLQVVNREMDLYKNDLSKFQEVKTELLGEQLKVMGRVKKNDMFDRLEFSVQLIEIAKAEEELTRLQNPQ